MLPAWVYFVFGLVWVAFFFLFSVYDSRQNVYVSGELTRVTIGSIVAAFVLAGILYLSYRDVSRFSFLLSVLLAYACMVGWRLAYRLAFRAWGGSEAETRRVLIIGSESVGREIEEKITSHHYLGFNLAGYLVNQDEEAEFAGSDAPVLGGLEATREVIEDFEVDDLIIALPGSAYEQIKQVLARVHDLPVKVWIIPDYYIVTLHSASVGEFAGIPLLDLWAPALNEHQRTLKRVFDLFVTVSLIIPALLLMGLISILIWLSDKGPVVVSQKRVGENGRLFDMYKFRTMVPGAEELQEQVEETDQEGNLIHKRADDPRVTRLGMFLRRSSLDELPQVFNVLKGEMSLVGPRPEIPYIVQRYEPWQHQRFAVPQGLTGWWQVNGRSDKPMHLHTEEDIYYIQHYSLWLDMLILIKTVWVVLRGKGAY